MSFTGRPKGHIRAVHTHPAAIHVAALVGATSSSTDSLVIRLPATIDMQLGEDCTGSYGKSVETWCSARGLACDPISRRFTYTLGREITAADPNAVLTDGGAIPTDVVEGMRTVGVVPESVCPGDDATVINDRLPFSMLQTAAVWRVTDVAIVPGSGAMRCSFIRAALAALYPVPFGMLVDASYEGLLGDAIYTGPTGPSLGGHAQRIVGCAPGKFLVAGSWGTGFGDAGFVWISDEVIGSDTLCYDFYALNAAPVVRA